MSTTRITGAKRNARSVARRRAAIALVIGAAVGAVACAGSDLDPDAPTLLTIAECREAGGAPLFDPADARPRSSSCPEGLGFLGEFEEPFFGSDGGICCGGLDSAEVEGAAEPEAAAEAEAEEPAEQVATEPAEPVLAEPEAEVAAQADEIAEADAGVSLRK